MNEIIEITSDSKTEYQTILEQDTMRKISKLLIKKH